MDNEMQQSDMRSKRNNQNRIVYVALTALFVAAVCLILVSRENGLTSMHTEKLILTQEACNYISSLGLVPTHDKLGCSIIARYSAGFLGSNGVILTDDDRFVALSLAAVLANAGTEEKLPDTPRQRRASIITDTVLAVMIVILTLMGYDLFESTKSDRQGSES